MALQFLLLFGLIMISTNYVESSTCPHGKLSANPSDCSTYFECNYGQTIVRPCPEGLHFNPQLSVCDWPRNVNCGPSPALPEYQCYSCTYAEGNPQLSNDGCERFNPPFEYLRDDCFSFGNLQAAGAVRHSSSNIKFGDGSTSNRGSNIHCVKISGKTEIGRKSVVLRGCENPAFNETYENKWKCFSRSDYNFVLPGSGIVKNVEMCYCRGNYCNFPKNGSAALNSYFSSVVFLFIYLVSLAV